MLKIRPKYFPALVALILATLWGCSAARNIVETSGEATRAVYRAVTPGKGKGDGLKKRVLVVPIIDHAALGADLTNKLTDDFIDRLEKGGGLLVEKSAFEISQDLRRRTPQYGIVVDPVLAEKSAEMGVNVLITSVLNPLESRIKSRYFWPIKRVKREIDVSMVVNLLDPINGTLYLTNMESRKREIDIDEFESQEREWDIEPEALQGRLRQIIEDHVSKIEKALQNHPWTGQIVNIADQGVQVNGGKDIGVIPGHVFEVFGEGEKLQSAGGQVLSLLGPKVGEIEVKEVGESHSLAVNLGDSLLESGQLVRLKN